LETAEREGAQYVLAQDPDSDRFSAAEKRCVTKCAARFFLDEDFTSEGQWTMFTGDQLGVLFAHHAFEIYKSSGKPLEKLAMVASTVSSKMIGAMAKVEGFKFVECLTGPWTSLHPFSL